MNGIGIHIWKNGNKYVGEYINDKKEGKGIYYWGKKNYYDGEWLNNRPHGYGEFNNGKSYSGYWRYGKPMFIMKEINSISNETYETISNKR